jgi:hypothetical protein
MDPSADAEVPTSSLRWNWYHLRAAAEPYRNLQGQSRKEDLERHPADKFAG